MAKPYPTEFRDDVVALARKGQAPLAQIAKDFGISDCCLHNWMKKADVEDGHGPGVTDADRAELRDLKKRNKLLEQENEVLRRAAAYLSQANLPGKQSSRSSVRWPRPVPASGCRSRWRAGCWASRPRGTTSGSTSRCRSGTTTTRTRSTRCTRSTRTTPRSGTGSWPTSWPMPGSPRARTVSTGSAGSRASGPLRRQEGQGRQARPAGA